MGYEEYSGFKGTVVWLAVASFIVSLSFNYFLNYGIVLTSPLFMRIVIILSVPASFIVNVILEGLPTLDTGLLLRIIGATLIVIGFIWFTLSDYFHKTNNENNQLTDSKIQK